MEKWSRIKYQPKLPLQPHEGGNGLLRVTGSEKHIDLSKQAAKEGMVLLKNEAGALPLEKGKRVALFGKATIDYVKGGGLPLRDVARLQLESGCLLCRR